MAQLYNIPTVDIKAMFPSLPTSSNLDKGIASATKSVDAASRITPEQKQTLISQGWIPDPTSYAINWTPTENEPERPYARLLNPDFVKFKEFLKSINYPVDAMVVWERGLPEVQLVIDNLKTNLERTQRTIQERLNWLYDAGGINTAGANAEIARIEDLAKQYNDQVGKLATGIQGVTGQPVQLQGTELPMEFKDVSQMVGGVYSATPNAQATPPTGLTPAQVEEWRKSQGLPTTAEMQAPGYQAPPLPTSTPGANPTGVPGAPGITGTTGTIGAMGATGATGTTTSSVLPAGLDLTGLSGDQIKIIEELYKGFQTDLDRGPLPPAELTPEQLANFLDVAKTELDPYYGEIISNTVKNLETSFGFATAARQAQIERTAREQAAEKEKLGQSLAERGVFYGGEESMGEQERAALEKTQQDVVESNRRTFAQSIGEAGKNVEEYLGSGTFRKVNVPTLEGLPIYTPSGTYTGSLTRERLAAEKARQGELSELERGIYSEQYY